MLAAKHFAIQGAVDFRVQISYCRPECTMKSQRTNIYLLVWWIAKSKKKSIYIQYPGLRYGLGRILFSVATDPDEGHNAKCGVLA